MAGLFFAHLQPDKESVVRNPALPISLLCTLVLCAPLTQAEDNQAPPQVVVLKAAHLFDSVSGKLTDNGMVVVDGDRIQAVGSDLSVPQGARVIDLGDATLMPGMIDSHVHLDGQFEENWYKGFYQDQTRSPAEQALYASKYARLTLEAGFTSVRDVGSTDYIAAALRNAIDAGVIEGPRMIVSNYAIGSTGGHADGQDLPPNVAPPYGPVQGVCNGPDECRAAVRYQMKYGATVVKFMPSGGVLSLNDPVDVPELTQAEMDAIVSEAHTWHRKVAAHCHGDLAAKMAIQAGVDSIEHGTFLKDDTLKSMKDKGVYSRADAVRQLLGGEQSEQLSARHPRQGPGRRGPIAADVPARGEAWRAHRLRHGFRGRAPRSGCPGVLAHDQERHVAGGRAHGRHREGC